jgi:hypothetical protein
MELTDEAIQEFKEIYKKEFHEDIDDATARILARRLLNLYEAVYGSYFNNLGKIQ